MMMNIDIVEDKKVFLEVAIFDIKVAGNLNVSQRVQY